MNCVTRIWNKVSVSGNPILRIQSEVVALGDDVSVHVIPADEDDSNDVDEANGVDGINSSESSKLR
jgi:hypothetical protein